MSAAQLEVLAGFKRSRVLVMGDLMLDRFVYGAVERLSPEAPVPVMAIQRTSNMPGGAANVARNVAALGGRVTVVGVVGADEQAGVLSGQLAEMPGIRPAPVVDASRPTTTKTRFVADRQQVLRTDVESSAPLSKELMDGLIRNFEAALSESDIVILSDYGKGVLSEEVLARAIRAATSAGKQVLVDPKSRSFQKYTGATVLTPNKQELQAACGHDCSTDEQVVDGARRILGQGICGTIVVTRGKDGMSIVSSTGVVSHIRTDAREVFDVTGAGDTAVAAMALGLASGADMETAARLSNIAAGIVVGKYGTATATVDEILSRIDDSAATDHSDNRYGLDAVLLLVAHWRMLGLKVAFTNGCFDMLHPGHLSLLNQARQTADRLVVGLNSDSSVRKLKGPTRPIQNSLARARVLSSLRAVDAVVIFDEDTPLNLITAIAPDVLVKGADYSVETVVGADFVLQRGGQVVLADLVPSQSTTETIRRVVAAAKP